MKKSFLSICILLAPMLSHAAGPFPDKCPDLNKMKIAIFDYALSGYLGYVLGGRIFDPGPGIGIWSLNISYVWDKDADHALAAANQAVHANAITVIDNKLPNCTYTIKLQTAYGAWDYTMNAYYLQG